MTLAGHNNHLKADDPDIETARNYDQSNRENTF